MEKLPHHYRVAAAGGSDGVVTVRADALPELETTPPPQYGGPGGYWSPETLLLAAVADCYLLSFRAVARASQLEWESLSCAVEGTLDRDADGVTRFTDIVLKPRLSLSAEADAERAQAVLAKAKRACLVSNSLNSHMTLEPALEQPA